MTKKIRVVEDSKEKLVTIDFALSRRLKAREVFIIDLDLRNNKTIELINEPILLSEFIYMNGSYLTEGIDFDYTINLKTITFNDYVLATRGHITINYEHLNMGV